MEIELARIFVKVVQNGSFSKAAALLRLPKSTVSRAVSRLEKDTGVVLLMRTTRSLTLTAAGRAFYETCAGPIQTLEDAGRSLQGGDSMMAGLVRITAPEDLGSHVISPLLARLSMQNPDLRFELHYSDRVVDLVKEGFDLAVRIGKLGPSRFKARKVGEVALIAVAAPAYLKSFGKIKSPGDLENASCLTYDLSAEQARWVLKSFRGTASVTVKPRIISNQMTSLVRMASEGAGVAFVPSYLAAADIRAGKLERVLPEWRAPGLPVSVISPLSSGASARLKLTIEKLAPAIQNALTPDD